MSEERYWVWIFADLHGLRWVLKNRRMAFPEKSGSRTQNLRQGDRAVLYLSRSAVGSAGGYVSRLAGIVQATGPVVMGDGEQIGERKYSWFVPIKPELVLSETEGPTVSSIAGRLERVKKPEIWGQYFRNSPAELSKRDFEVMQTAIRATKSGT